jgi:LuxR family maltose regulon positive regulatory protein
MVHVVARAQIQNGLLLCEAAILRRDPAAAAEEIRTVRGYLPEEPEAVVLHAWAEELEGRLAQLRSVGPAVELTAAELRVLGQLPTHRSLVEIGEHLYVSRNTVKTHTLSIYRKLGVSGRSEAVGRAGELGLLTVQGASGADHPFGVTTRARPNGEP